MKHSLQIQKSDSGQQGVLTLGGELTIGHAQELKNILLEAIEKTDSLEIHLNDVEHADVSFLQMICATHRECLKHDKSVLCKGDKKTCNVFHDGGFSRQIGCPEHSRASCAIVEICK